MTVAAWDGKTLAVDRQGNCESWGYRTRKLHLDPKKQIAIALAGELGRCASVARWILAGQDPDTFPEFQADEDRAVDAIVVIRGQAHIVALTPELVPVFGPFHAIGSGRDFALAAMRLGQNAIQAVELASLLCETCGQGVDWAECR